MTVNEKYGASLLDLADRQNLIVIDADISRASKTYFFKEKYPDRFFNAGIAEQNMMSIASGIATMGYIPITHSLAKFITTRALDQIINGIAYPNLNVKMVGIYAGLSIGKDGATHQALEDIAVLNTIPNMTIVCPGSMEEVEELLKQSLDVNQPTYIRLCAGLTPKLANDYIKFGEANRLTTGTKVTVISTGVLTDFIYEVITENNLVDKVELIHIHTIKPIATDTIVTSALKTKNVLTIEDHNLIGGLGSIVTDALSKHYSEVQIKKIGINDVFGCSGSVEDLYHKYGLSKKHILEYITEAIKAI